MIILHGIYRLDNKRTAYRSDYCLSCKAPRVAEQYRSFNILHIFFVPLVPLGLWTRWRCLTCKNDPHARVSTSRPITIIAVLLMLLAVASTFAVSPAEMHEDNPYLVLWGTRFGLAVVIAGLIASLRMTKGQAIPLKDTLQSVTPLPRDKCFYCDGWLQTGDYCPRCAVRRLEV